MFLIPFPFSDIIYFVYMLITWVYLAFGMWGGITQPVNKEVIAVGQSEFVSYSHANNAYSNHSSSYYFQQAPDIIRKGIILICLVICVLPLAFCAIFTYQLGHFGRKPSKRGPPSYFLFN